MKAARGFSRVSVESLYFYAISAPRVRVFLFIFLFGIERRRERKNERQGIVRAINLGAGQPCHKWFKIQTISGSLRAGQSSLGDKRAFPPCEILRFNNGRRTFSSETAALSRWRERGRVRTHVFFCPGAGLRSRQFRNGGAKSN